MPGLASQRPLPSARQDGRDRPRRPLAERLREDRHGLAGRPSARTRRADPAAVDDLERRSLRVTPRWSKVASAPRVVPASFGATRR